MNEETKLRAKLNNLNVGNGIKKLSRSRLRYVLIIGLLLFLAACSSAVNQAPTGNQQPEASWTSQDIGNVAVAGDTVVTTPSALTVLGSGQDIWGQADSFQFAYQVVEGDVEIIARILGIENTDKFAKAGLMIRESLNPDAANAMVHLSPDNVGISFQWRSAAGDITDFSKGGNVSGPYWVKLTREGNTFRGYESIDGQDWTLTGTQNISMSNQVYVGMAVTSHDNSVAAEALFDNVTVNAVSQPVDQPAPTPAPTPAPVPSDDDYYIAPNGNDNNPGTIEQPFATIKKAASVVRPGDTVYLRGGVYYEYNSDPATFPTSGTRDNPITFQSYPGELAIIDGSEISPEYGGAAHPILLRISADWYIFRDLAIRNSSGRGIYAAVNNSILENLDVYANTDTGLYLIGDNNLVTNSRFRDQDCYLLEGECGNGMLVLGGDSNIIRYNLYYGNSDDGLSTRRGTNTIVEYNASFDNGRYAAGDGNGYKMGTDGEGVPNNSGNTYRFNIAYDNRANNFDSNGGGGLILYNNISFNSGRDGFQAATPTSAPNTLRNNISFQDAKIAGMSGADDQYNSWNLGITDPNFISLTPPANPTSWQDFVDAGFLKLAANSPAVDAGIDVGLEYEGAAPDLGAFEWDLSLSASRAR